MINLIWALDQIRLDFDVFLIKSDCRFELFPLVKFDPTYLGVLISLTYGTISPGREMAQIDVPVLKSLETFCDQTKRAILVFSTVSERPTLHSTTLK